jgi:hypothetical protein
MLKTQIAKVLRDAVIDPKKDTAYKFVVELNSQVYCVTKARDILNTLEPSKKISTEAIKQAITLLAMSLCMVKEPKSDGKLPPAQSRS